MKKKKQKYFEDSVSSVQKKLHQVLVSKQKDYGSRNILDCGMVGVITRVNDKLARLKNLYGMTDGSYKQKKATNEAIEDTWVDIANYATIALMIQSNQFDLPLKDEE